LEQIFFAFSGIDDGTLSLWAGTHTLLLALELRLKAHLILAEGMDCESPGNATWEMEIRSLQFASRIDGRIY
jgi:hypothetical protein